MDATGPGARPHKPKRKMGGRCRVYSKPQSQASSPQPLNQRTGKPGKVVKPKKQSKKPKRKVQHVRGPLASGSATKPGTLIGKKPKKHVKHGKVKHGNTTRKTPCGGGKSGPKPLAAPP